MQEALVILLMLLALAIISVPMIWTLVDCLKSDFKDPTMKIIWVGLTVFLFPLGMILYWFMARDQKVLKGPSE
jgi:Na+-driven multidrug efflux pump